MEKRSGPPDGCRWIGKRRYYPYRKKCGGCRGTRVLVGIGGNIGDVPRRFDKLWIALSAQKGIETVASSEILLNPPFGYADQPDFYNAVIELVTKLTPMQLLFRLQEIERRFGRRRSFPNAPRSLDLDILFYGNTRVGRRRLVIPHPGWRSRDSVLLPLMKLKGSRWLKRLSKRRHPQKHSI